MVGILVHGDNHFLRNTPDIKVGDDFKGYQK